MHTKLVTVFGGSGFLGRYVVRRLAQTGWRVRVAVRRPDLAGHLQPLGGVGQIHAVQANLRDRASIARALEGVDAVVNLVGILAEKGQQNFSPLHVDGVRMLAQEALKLGISSFVHVSSIAADAQAPSLYAQTKAAGEEALRVILPKAIILRPSVMFGAEDRFFNSFAKIAMISPIFPLIGRGEPRFQPIYVDDVAAAIVSALEGKVAPGAIYELGGGEIVSLEDIANFVLKTTHRKSRFAYIPFGLAKIQASFLQLLPSPPLTVDQVRLLERDAVVSEKAYDEGRTLQAFGINPTPYASVVPRYLVSYRPYGQFAQKT